MQSRFDITIAGEINLDLILYGLPENMPQERELLASDFRLTLGSSSAILAHNLSVLGASVGFITRLGNDPLGAIALDRLSEGGVDLSRVKRVLGRASTGCASPNLHPAETLNRSPNILTVKRVSDSPRLVLPGKL
jgi:sugar/nucleoside kinase (ribokinase family)